MFLGLAQVGLVVGALIGLGLVLCAAHGFVALRLGVQAEGQFRLGSFGLRWVVSSRPQNLGGDTSPMGERTSDDAGGLIKPRVAPAERRHVSLPKPRRNQFWRRLRSLRSL